MHTSVEPKRLMVDPLGHLPLRGASMYASFLLLRIIHTIAAMTIIAPMPIIIVGILMLLQVNVLFKSKYGTFQSKR
jgi:hypothetical protein